MGRFDFLFYALFTASSCVFAVSGILHGIYNSYFRDEAELRVSLLRFYYGSVLAFTICVGWAAAGTSHQWVTDALGLSILIIIVHGVRGYTDWLDLKPRGKKFPWARAIMDALANYITIIMTLIAHTAGDRWMSLVGLLFGIMFVAKEFYFRIKGDIFTRRDAPVTTTQGGSGEPTDPDITTIQAFFGRYVKSLFYILIGFAIEYLLIPSAFPQVTDFYSSLGSGQDMPLDALWFSIATLTFNFPSKLHPLVELTAMLQFCAASIFYGLVAVKIFTEVKARISQPKT